MTKATAIIPARSGSKGIIDKNLASLGGFPLIAYSIAAAKLSSSIGRVIVSTDSEQYAEISRFMVLRFLFCDQMTYLATQQQILDSCSMQ